MPVFWNSVYKLYIFRYQAIRTSFILSRIFRSPKTNRF